MLMEGFMEGFKKDINNSFKEIQENTSKQWEALEELKEKTIKQVKELNKATQDLKKEVETIMKSQKRDNSGHRKLRKEVRSHESKH